MAREQTTSAMRCLVLGPEGEPMPTDLEGAMARQGLRIEACVDAYHAMTQMVVHDVDGASSAQGLIIVEPARVRHGAVLIETASTYAPHVVLWRYATDSAPRLARITEAPHAQRTTVAAPPMPARSPLPHEGRGLRLVGTDVPPRTVQEGDILDGEGPMVNDERPGGVLTQEELALLLATDETDTAEGT